MKAAAITAPGGPPDPAFSVAEAEALPLLDDEPGGEIRGGLVVAGLFFGLFLGWAAIAPLDAAAYGEGQVIVSGQRQAVQHRDGGVVAEISVREGQRVERGQVLLRLAAAEVQAQEQALSLQAIDLLAHRARLNAEQLGLRVIPPPPEFAGLTDSNRIAADRAMQLQMTQLRTRSSLLATQQQVLGQDAERAREQRLGKQDQLQAIREQERLVGEEIEMLKPLAEKRIVSQTELRDLERTRAELAGQRGLLEAAISETLTSAGQSRLKVVETREALFEKIAAELREVEASLSDVAPKLRAAKDQLARTEVRAPTSGAVVGLTVFNQGGVIAPGQKLMDIVPEKASMLVEVRLSPNDADDLRVGQEATVRFSGLANRELPPLHGTLKRISADAFIAEKTGTPYFTGDIDIPPGQLRLIERELGVGFALKPGMPAQILVPLRKRTALEYMLEPLTGSLWKSLREH